LGKRFPTPRIYLVVLIFLSMIAFHPYLGGCPDSFLGYANPQAVDLENLVTFLQEEQSAIGFEGLSSICLSDLIFSDLNSHPSLQGNSVSRALVLRC
jgi:hypothetical protein